MQFLRVTRIFVCDFFASGLWVFYTAVLGEVGSQLSALTGYGELTSVISLIVIGLVFMCFICEGLGGAAFNPAVTASFATAGKEPLLQSLLRMGFQTLGGVAAGYAAIFALGESFLKDLSIGVRPGISIIEGAVCEFILSLISCVVIIASCGLKNRILMLTIQLGATVLLILGGLEFTGPSMNPQVTFCWFWHFEGHSSYEHFLVFWAAPMIGAVIAGMLTMESKAKPSRSRKKVKST